MARASSPSYRSLSVGVTAILQLLARNARAKTSPRRTASVLGEVSGREQGMSLEPSQARGASSQSTGTIKQSRSR
jgi:hypothetical protein